MEKLIITCALTGSLTVPAQTPYLPITPQQIADEAVRAAEAGAAIIHVHARNPENGQPTADLDTFRDILTRTKGRTNAILGITTGGGPGMTPEERILVVPTFKPELASFNMGPVCLNVAPLANRIKDEDFKYPWEKPFLQSTGGIIQHNTFTTLELYLKTMNENDTKNECECYDVGHIYNVGYFYREGIMKPPVWIQFVTGGLGAIGSAQEDIIHMKRTADRLLGEDNYQWSLIGTGAVVFRNAALAIGLGGHVRVGFEDNIFLERRVLAKSNAELVEKVMRLARELGREVATPDEARSILKLKGKDKVNY